MIQVYSVDGGKVIRSGPGTGLVLPEGAVWVDLISPDDDMIAAVERQLGIDLPSREEMREIETSSRVREEEEGLYLTATVISKSDTDAPERTAISFILAGQRLVTLRHAEPAPFGTFAAYLLRHPQACASGDLLLIGLLEAIVDRLADILERAGDEVDSLSRRVFLADDARPGSLDFHETLRHTGKIGDLLSKARESLATLARVFTFLAQAFAESASKERRNRIRTLSLDAQSLSDYLAFLSNKVSFLLEATLGMINIEQSNIIKLFSVMAVVFLPPTLVATIYGMNFHVMPELDWPLGYPLALLVMLASAVLPYLFFKWKRWL